MKRWEAMDLEIRKAENSSKEQGATKRKGRPSVVAGLRLEAEKG